MATPVEMFFELASFSKINILVPGHSLEYVLVPDNDVIYALPKTVVDSEGSLFFSKNQCYYKVNLDKRGGIDSVSVETASGKYKPHESLYQGTKGLFGILQEWVDQK